MGHNKMTLSGKVISASNSKWLFQFQLYYQSQGTFPSFAIGHICLMIHWDKLNNLLSVQWSIPTWLPYLQYIQYRYTVRRGILLCLSNGEVLYNVQYSNIIRLNWQVYQYFHSGSDWTAALGHRGKCSQFNKTRTTRFAAFSVVWQDSVGTWGVNVANGHTPKLLCRWLN